MKFWRLIFSAQLTLHGSSLTKTSLKLLQNWSIDISFFKIMKIYFLSITSFFRQNVRLRFVVNSKHLAILTSSASIFLHDLEKHELNLLVFSYIRVKKITSYYTLKSWLENLICVLFHSWKKIACKSTLFVKLFIVENSYLA